MGMPNLEENLERLRGIKNEIDDLSNEALFLIKHSLDSPEYFKSQQHWWNSVQFALEDYTGMGQYSLDDAIIALENKLGKLAATANDPEVDVGIESPMEEIEEDEFHQAVS
jgi:hypothetical protein